jgi:hypothetical protein
LDSCGQREKVKGERENTKAFPLSRSPFPDLCKKSNILTANSTKLDNILLDLPKEIAKDCNVLASISLGLPSDN